MKLQQKPGNITRGAIVSVKQTIAQENIAAAVLMLRDKIYTDKLKAAIQETICNAVDEHRKYNVDCRVKVIITKNEVCIRDFAKGLDRDGVLNTFFQFFSSTKNDTNDAIGGFGIGAKAPGAFADIWTVESWHNCKHSVYTSVTEGQEATASLVFEEECSPEETGIMVRIPFVNCFYAIKECCCSMAAMIGVNDVCSWLEVYSVAPENESTFEDIFSSEKYTIYNLDYTHCHPDLALLSVSRLRDVFSETKTCAPGKMYILTKDSFSSCVSYSFWKSERILFYDGDVLYRGTTEIRSRIVSILSNAVHLRSYDHVIIVMFERGKLNVAPSRETIEIDDAVTSLVDESAKAVADYVRQEVIDYINEIGLANVCHKWSIYNEDYYSRKNNLFLECAAGIINDCSFVPAMHFAVKKSNSRSGFSLLSRKCERISLRDFDSCTCIVDASEIVDKTSIARQLRNWVDSNEGEHCQYTRFYVLATEDNVKTVWKKCTVGSKCLLTEGINLFKASDFDIINEHSKKRQAKKPSAKRKETPITLTYFGTHTVVPEEEYHRTVFCTTYTMVNKYISDDFYKVLGYTGVVMVPLTRVEKIKRLGFHSGDDIPPRLYSKKAIIKEIDKVIRYLRSKKLIVCSGDLFENFRRLPYNCVSSLWGYDILNCHTSMFLEELHGKFYAYMSEALKKKFSDEEYTVLCAISSNTYLYADPSLMSRERLRKIRTNLLENKYQHKLSAIMKTIPYNRIISEVRDAAVQQINNNTALDD